MSTHDVEGILLLVQSQLASIPEKDILSALPEEQLKRPRVLIPIDGPQLNHDELDAVDWHDARLRQVRLFEERVRPALLAHPAYRVAYFGLAPVPLAIHLGYLFGSMRPVDIYQQHHEDKDWRWHGRAQSSKPRLQPVELPRDKFGGRGDATIRIATSYQIDPSHTLEVVPQPAREVDIQLVTLAPDALGLPEDLSCVAQSFREALTALVNCLPNLDNVHLFASVPVGMAFLLGTCINPTLPHQIQVYQYFGSRAPRYRLAFALKGNGDDRPMLSAEEINTAAELRKMWAEEAQSLRRFSKNLHEVHNKGAAGSVPWLSLVLPQSELVEKLMGAWQELPCLFDTPLADSHVALDGEIPLDGFQYDEKASSWRLSDPMLLAIRKQHPNEANFRQAGRLFLLHEGVHIQAHQLTSETSRWVGRFPKMVEEVDYQADVWAILHEFAYARSDSRREFPSDSEFFQSLLEVVLATIWAFGESAVPLSALPVRRLNRYLLWFWQEMRVARCSKLSDILTVLAQRPIIELAGLPMKIRSDEFCYLLRPEGNDFLEIAVLHGNAMKREGETRAVRLSEILEGFRQRDRGRVKAALKGAFDAIVPWQTRRSA